MSCNYDIHVCLISAQAAANFLPVIQKEFKPKECLFFVSKEMKNNAEYLANTLKEQHIKTTFCQLDDVVDFPNMENTMLEFLQQYEDKNIVLNVTGGTKLMALAAQNAFNLLGKPIFYVDTEHNRLVFITKDENNQYIPDLPLSAEIDLSNYLSSYGMKLLNKPQTTLSEKDQRLVSDIKALFINQYDKNKNNLPSINLKASESQYKGYKAELGPKDNYLKSILSELDLLNIIEFDGNTINFKNKEMKEFVNGGWFEKYCLQQLNSISKLNEVYCSVEIGNRFYDVKKSSFDNKNQGNMNEFDLTFMYKNKLHIIECKTQLMSGKEDKKIKAEDFLYKLETIKHYGGLMTEKCLISYFEVPENVKNRAKELQINIIDGEKVKNLQQAISTWIK